MSAFFRALPGVHDAYFMLGGNPGVNGDLGQDFVQFFVCHIVQLGTVQRAAALGEDADLPGDGRGCDLVVAGDHDGADAAPLGVGHRLHALGPGRVDHGDEAHKGEVGLIL